MRQLFYSFRISKSILGATLLATMILFTYACEEDCPEGFSGGDCEIRASDRFIGTYEGTVNCGLNDQFASMEIYRKNGPFNITLDITTTPGFVFDAYISEDSMFIEEQIVSLIQGEDIYYYIIFDSAGKLNQDSLDFEMIILFPGNPDQEKVSCNYQLIK